MPEPLRAAELDGFPDRRQAERLPRVDRDLEVLPLHVLEGVQMTARRPARLRARDVEAHHAQVPVADGQLGDLQRSCRGPYGREQPADDDPGPRAPEAEPLQHRLDHLIEAQSPVDMQLGSEPDLGVDDAVRGQVLSAFGGDPDQRLRCLHDRDRVLERLQVQLKMTTFGRRRSSTGPARPDRCSADHRSRRPRPAPRWSGGAGRRPGGRAAGPSARRGSAQCSGSRAHCERFRPAALDGVSRPADTTWLAGTQTRGPGHR